MKNKLSAIFFLFLFSCSTIPAIKSVSDFKQSAKEADKIKVTTEADQVRKDHIISTLNQCTQLEKDYIQLQKSFAELQTKYLSISKEAGAGHLVYTFLYIGLAITGMALFIYILKKFSIF